MGKKKNNTNHHMGKQSGYDLIDGVYHIAPMYCKRFDDFRLRKAGIDEMLACVTGHASEELEQLYGQRKRLWDEIAEDLDLDASVPWIYYNGTIKKQEPES